MGFGAAKIIGIPKTHWRASTHPTALVRIIDIFPASIPSWIFYVNKSLQIPAMRIIIENFAVSNSTRSQEYNHGYYGYL